VRRPLPPPSRRRQAAAAKLSLPPRHHQAAAAAVLCDATALPPLPPSCRHCAVRIVAGDVATKDQAAIAAI